MTFRGTWSANPTPYPRPEETWVWRQVDKIGRDTLPINQDDYPNPIPPYRIEQTWLVNHTPFLGKDKFYGSPGFAPDFDYPNPQPVQWYWDWSQNFALYNQVAQKPFSQQDWPNTQPVQWYRDWTESGNSLGTLGVPANQNNWPNPSSVTWYQSWTQCLLQNTLAATPAAIPFNQYQWTTPYPIQWYQDWKQSPQVPAAPFPFAQDDWPNPTQPSRLDQSWTWNQTKYLGKDRLPNRQQDWPIPYPIQWYQDYQVNLLQTTLFTTPALPSIRQYDWPLPRTYEPLVPSWTYTSQFIIPVPVIPTFITGGRQLGPGPESKYQAELRQLATQRHVLEAAATLAKRGGEARAKSLSPSQRSAIASHAASTRWKK